jgi:glycerol kinase
MSHPCGSLVSHIVHRCPYHPYPQHYHRPHFYHNHLLGNKYHLSNRFSIFKHKNNSNNNYNFKTQNRNRMRSSNESIQQCLIGALDQGTTSTRFILFDSKTLHQVACYQLPHEQYHPGPGWSEHDPMEILDKSRTCIVKAMEQLQSSDVSSSLYKNAQLLAMGITNQRETTVVWDSQTGEPLYRAIVWNDLRTNSLVEQIIGENKRATLTENNNNITIAGRDNNSMGPSDAYFLQKLCGLPVSTYFSALKLRWLIENVERVKVAIQQGRCMFGTMDSWLIWNLTGGINGGKHVTDVTNASRTMLMNIEKLDWDNELKRVFKIPDNGLILPEIKSNTELFGHAQLDLNNSRLRIPITGCVGDQQSAVIGQRCFKEGEAKNTYGTGCFLLMNTGERPVYSKYGLLTTICYKLGAEQKAVYALEGSVAVAGSGIKWLKDNLGIISSFEESEHLASTVKNTGGVYFVPAFSGLFAPYWRPDARGTIVGLTQYSTKAHICRAMIEAVSHQTQEVLEAMHKDSNVSVSHLKVDGGMSNNNVLLQSQADLLGVPVIKPKYIETTALGAAICAALGSGIYSSIEQIPSLFSNETTTFESQISQQQRELELKRWDMAVSRSLNSIEFHNK